MTAAALHLAALTDRALVRVAGADARPFLHNLLTQDVEGLAPGELRYGALLTPQGRLLNELFLLGEADSVVLDAPAAQREALVARLKLYRLRAKATIEPLDEPVFAGWTTGGPVEAPGPAWRPDPRSPELGIRAYGAPDLEQASADALDYDAHRLRWGVPAAADLLEDRTYPIEADFDLLNGIDFRKGCFVGQETTSRMKRRGPIKTRLVPITFDGAAPPFGAEVLAGELRAGEVRSGGPGRALALLRIDRAVGAALTVEGRPVRLDPPPWLEPTLQPPEPAHISSGQEVV